MSASNCPLNSGLLSSCSAWFGSRASTERNCVERICWVFFCTAIIFWSGVSGLSSISALASSSRLSAFCGLVITSLRASFSAASLTVIAFLTLPRYSKSAMRPAVSARARCSCIASAARESALGALANASAACSENRVSSLSPAPCQLPASSSACSSCAHWLCIDSAVDTVQKSLSRWRVSSAYFFNDSPTLAATPTKGLFMRGVLYCVTACGVSDCSYCGNTGMGWCPYICIVCGTELSDLACAPVDP